MRRVRGSTAIQTDYNRSVSATKRSRPARQLVVRPEGLEPPTLWSEARCSNPLSYGRVSGAILPTREGCWSGREDLNLRPRRPERRALPSCATPRPNATPGERQSIPQSGFEASMAAEMRTPNQRLENSPQTNSRAHCPAIQRETDSNSPSAERLWSHQRRLLPNLWEPSSAQIGHTEPPIHQQGSWIQRFEDTRALVPLESPQVAIVFGAFA